jgi:aconitase B
MKLGMIMKLAKGGIGPDELGEILAAAGIEASFRKAVADLDTFRPFAELASLPSSELLELRGTMKGGKRLHALMVIGE